MMYAEPDGFDAAASYLPGNVLVSLLAKGCPVKGIRLTLPEAKELEFRLRRAIRDAKVAVEKEHGNGPA